PEARHKGISALIVEREWPGVTTRETEHKLGVWAGSTGELFFENVEVPAENLVGEEGQGFEIAMYGLDQGRFTVAAGGCGVLRGRPRHPGARRVRLLGGVRDRAVFPQRAGADHLRGDDADPQADAGRARARLPGAERPRRRHLAHRVLGFDARSGSVSGAP